MNKNLEETLKLALDEITKMSADDFFTELYGYTPAEEQAYTEEQFLVELEHLRTFFTEGSYTFHPPFVGEVVPELSKLFWNFISKNARSDYEDTTAVFPTYYVEVPKYGIRVTHVYGQGTLTTVEEFDFRNIEYIVRNATRLKREHAWNVQEKLKQFLRGKPQRLDEVTFSTEINGTIVEDTGVIETVYTKKNILRYLIDSVNHGKVIVYFENEDYIHDTVKVTVLHPDNYDNS